MPRLLYVLFYPCIDKCPGTNRVTANVFGHAYLTVQLLINRVIYICYVLLIEVIVAEVNTQVVQDITFHLFISKGYHEN